MKKSYAYIKSKCVKILLSILCLTIITSIIILLILTKLDSKNIVNHRLQWWLNAIEWDDDRMELSGKDTTIAILDTGVDFTHKDLRLCNYSEESIVSISEDDKNHGTAIAGIISAYPNNEKGVLGISPKANLISIDITNQETVDIDNLIKGIKKATERNVDIINISIGVKDGNDELYECIKKAYDNGIIIVASAGNYMKDEILYPAAYDEVIAVGAYDRKGNIISPKGNVENVIYLPGSSVVSCLTNNNYSGVQGTSFSTAIMSGMMAIIKEANSKLSNKELYKKIFEVSMSYENKITLKQILEEIEE